MDKSTTRSVLSTPALSTPALSTPANNTRKRVWQYIEKEKKNARVLLYLLNKLRNRDRI